MNQTATQTNGAAADALQQEEIIPTLITHGGVFHADETMAIAIISTIWPKAVENIMLTRDEALIQKIVDCPKPKDNPNDVPHYIVLDVGRKYDPACHLFDHHQPEGAGYRGNHRAPYATSGLVWKKYGAEVIRRMTGEEDPDRVAKIWEAVDSKLIEGIDLADNGEGDFVEDRVMTLPKLIRQSNPSVWEDPKKVKDARFAAIMLCIQTLGNTVRNELFQIYAEDSLKSTFIVAFQEGQRIVELKLYSPNWVRVLHSLPDFTAKVAFVIYKDVDADAGWRAQAVPMGIGTRSSNRVNFPSEWGGVDSKTLQQLSGVEDAIFCHGRGFIAGARSKLGVIELAKKAIELTGSAA